MLQGQQSQPAVVCWHWEMFLSVNVCTGRFGPASCCQFCGWKDSFNAQTSGETGEKTQTREGKKKVGIILTVFFKKTFYLAPRDTTWDIFCSVLVSSCICHACVVCFSSMWESCHFSSVWRRAAPRALLKTPQEKKLQGSKQPFPAGSRGELGLGL